MMPHWILALRSRKRSRVAGQRAEHRDGQEHVDRDEDGEQVEAAQPDQHVLQRQHDEEGQDQAAVVAAPGVRQRDELAQRQEGEHAEQQRRADRPRHPGQPEHQRADPQRAQVAQLPRVLVRAARCPAARSVRTNTAMLASASRPNRITNSSATCCSTPSERSAFMCSATAAARTTAARARSRKSRLSSPGSQLHRRAEGDGAQDRHRHHLALGHDALHVVDPDRDQLHAGELLGQVVQPALEGQRLALVAARALGKDDQRVALLQRLDQRLQRVLVVGALAADVDRVEDLARQPVLERAGGPVVARRDRPRAHAQVVGQRGPDQHPVEVALVVGEVDALQGLGRAALPVALRAGDQAGDEGHQHAHDLDRDRHAAMVA